jgi:hypothetical protein
MQRNFSAYVFCCLFILCEVEVGGNVFPSIRAGLIIPGYAQDPTDPVTLLTIRNASEVSKWEVAHSDIAYGGSFDDAKLRDGLVSLGYMYIQALSFDPYDIEMDFRIRALDENGRCRLHPLYLLLYCVTVLPCMTANASLYDIN